MTRRSRASGISADLLVVGLNVRPLALSARRAGHRVASADCFGDRDHREHVRNLSLKRDAGGGPFSAERLADLARRVRAPEVAYGADFETRPDLVRRLASGRTLLGTPPATLERARDPRRFRRAAEAAGVPALRVLLPGEEPEARGEGAVRWMRKRRVGSGGRGVAPWDGSPLSPDELLQERASGRPGSILFVADGREAAPLGISEMLVGRREFGGSGYRYCGSLLLRRFPAGGGSDPAAPSAPGAGVARRLVSALAAELGLVGLCGVDVLAGEDGAARPIEVNARYTAAMELLEGAPGETPLFALHRRACLGGGLPEAERAGSPSARRGGAGGEEGKRPAVRGKAVLRARGPVRAPDLLELEGVEMADVPDPGEEIPAGGPICTVFAEEPNRDSCLEGLRKAARAVYGVLEKRESAAPSRPGPG